MSQLVSDVVFYSECSRLTSLLYNIAVDEEEPEVAPDLQSFPCLETLWYYLAPSAQPHDTRMLSVLQNTLASWVTSNSNGRDPGHRPAIPLRRRLYLEPYRRDIFQRDEFVNLVRAIGPVIEAALCRQTISAGDPQAVLDTGGKTGTETDPCSANVVVQDLGDTLDRADWWMTRIQDCFPTFVKWKRLEVYPCHKGECVSLHLYVLCGGHTSRSRARSSPVDVRTRTEPGDFLDNTVSKWIEHESTREQLLESLISALPSDRTQEGTAAV